ncbi:rod-binding protein [Bosea sp. BK604]|uniref:rod-binding protein n=1 Tax=Bosea sp. BK604 TaxID=2512180 RepID=UPI0010437DE1|nr:rod-binding protein [Bosea sp. BK604]TCR63660.1 rod binding protein [Bosea sp. BK604]
MAISPPSDIVLDVTRAADPMRQQVAFDRLARLSVPGASGTLFASAIDEAAPGRSGAGLAGAREKLAALAPAKPGDAEATPEAQKTKKTLQRFEAQVISTFIEQMMPEATTNTFGDGMAGGVWRSMLSEQIAGELAKSGGLGIRDKIAAAMAARNAGAPADPNATVTAGLGERLLDRSNAASGANGRDQRIPLVIEQQFLNATKPAHKGTVRTSIIRQA